MTQMMETGSVTQRKAHVLILPFEEQGHFTVYLQLLYYLGHYDIRVTFCSTEARCQEVAALRSKGAFRNLDLHFESIFSPPKVTDEPKKEGDVPPLWKFFSVMKAEFKAYLPRLMDETDPNARPTFLLADVFVGWAEEIAEKLDIPRYVVFPSSAWAPLGFLWRQGVTFTPDDIVTFPGMSPSRIKDGVPPVLDTLISVKNAAGIVCNSFEEMEKGSIDAARSHLHERPNSNGQVTKFLPIGPTLILPGNPTLPYEMEPTRYLEWLDCKAPSSVLYVAFGTQAKLSERSIIEVAHGIEASNVPFLWALRLPNGVTELSSILPPGFLERTKDRGYVETSFAPQPQILSHSSTGGFLSHSGWNSSIESMCAGVPVICHPLHGDTGLNSRVLAEITKTGIAIPRSDDGGFTRVDITKSIKLLMTEEEGQEVRKNAAKWKELALASQADGGSSERNVRQFVQDILDSVVRK